MSIGALVLLVIEEFRVSSWWMVLNLLPGILFWGLILTLVVVVVRRRPDPRREPSEALRLVEERFARGEIDAEELRTMRKTLRDTGP